MSRPKLLLSRERDPSRKSGERFQGCETMSGGRPFQPGREVLSLLPVRGGMEGCRRRNIISLCRNDCEAGPGDVLSSSPSRVQEILPRRITCLPTNNTRRKMKVTKRNTVRNFIDPIVKPSVGDDPIRSPIRGGVCRISQTGQGNKEMSYEARARLGVVKDRDWIDRHVCRHVLPHAVVVGCGVCPSQVIDTH